MAPAPAPGPAQAGQRGAQALSGPGRVQHDRSAGPAPVRYVNFLACEGYTVEIIGGKHFKTPEGEFVEMKSGTQYKIHVKNTRAYGKHYFSINTYNQPFSRWIEIYSVDSVIHLLNNRPLKNSQTGT